METRNCVERITDDGITKVAMTGDAPFRTGRT
jgi:hypothetical protein